MGWEDDQVLCRNCGRRRGVHMMMGTRAATRYYCTTVAGEFLPTAAAQARRCGTCGGPWIDCAEPADGFCAQCGPDAGALPVPTHPSEDYKQGRAQGRREACRAVLEELRDAFALDACASDATVDALMRRVEARLPQPEEP